ncbi:MAG: 50S ribosomal protein L18 [Bacteriovoracaceae bacterium]|jgi:large subunit ribosomal protein L18|nr:50S ribosomal protein L18 [Bacteriovoracaceae bacterium]
MRKQYGKVANKKDQRRQKRRLTIRNKISGTSERPRICAMKSNKHITVQVIDDTKSVSLFTVSTFGKNAAAESCNIEGAKIVGARVASVLKSKNLNAAVFDRAGYKYTGVIAALVQSIRESGIQV